MAINFFFEILKYKMAAVHFEKFLFFVTWNFRNSEGFLTLYTVQGTLPKKYFYFLVIF